MGGTGKQYLYDDGIDDGGVNLLIINLIPLLIFLYNLFYLVSDRSFLRIFLDFIDSFILKNLSYIQPRN